MESIGGRNGVATMSLGCHNDGDSRAIEGYYEVRIRSERGQISVNMRSVLGILKVTLRSI